MDSDILGYKINIDCENAAFADDPDAEMARILHALADRFESGRVSKMGYTLHDINGNPIGECLAQF